MRLPGLKTAETFSRWLRARVLGGALILGYHRISATQEDVYEVCVSPENFAGHMEALKKYACPIGLSRLVQSLKQNALPPKSVAVTFDDGYADNFYEAKPVLEKYEIPATVFVCTGYLGKEFWWDELNRLLNRSQTDPDALHLRAGGKPFRWHKKNASPHVGPPAAREEFGRALYRYLLSLDIEDQNHAMTVIRNWSNLSSPGISTSRTLSEKELLRLADGGLIEIGAHTRYHPMLPALSMERQREEIHKNKIELEVLLGKPIKGFAYPNGKATACAKQIVREVGFEYACTSLHDVVRPEGDIYELTRFWQRDVDTDKFMQGLNQWMKA